MQRKKIVLSITLALGLAQNQVHAQFDFDPVIQLGDINGTIGFRLDGVAAGDFSGIAVSTAGDVNGDGLDDLIIGADRADPNGSSSGSSYVVFGNNTGFNATINLSTLDGSNGFRLDGAAENDFSGRAVSAAGDVNGDGFDDLLIGAFGAGSISGSSYVVFGNNTGFNATMNLSTLDGSNGFRLDGTAEYDASGRAVSTAGDVNGDGFDDLLIGAYGADLNDGLSGSSYLVFGTNTGFNATLDLSTLDGSNGFRLDGAAENDFSGRTVSTAGDVNGDGFDDLLIGAVGATPNGTYSGSSYVVFGKSTPFTATQNLSTLDGTNGFRLDGAASDRSGDAVSAAGDVNGDGFDDLLIGAVGAGSFSGRSYVVFGKSAPFTATMNLSTLDGTNGFRLDGAASDRSGDAVSAAGDVNGDGFDDLLIGAIGAEPNGSSSGSSYVVFGKDTGFNATQNLNTLDGTNGFRLDGAANGDFSGGSVSTAGDINGDGFDDLLFGAYGADPNGSFSGSSYVFFGRTAGIPLINFDQELFNFGDTILGTSSDVATVTLSNPGTGNASIVTINLADPAFSITGGSCGTTPFLIQFGESCTLDLQFTPQAVGSALIKTVFEGNSFTTPDSITLAGNGVLPPMVSLQPDPLVFMDTPVGNSNIETLTVENIGQNSTLEPGMVSILGTDAADFSIAMNNCMGAQLELNQSCDIEVSFTPSAAGTREAVLQLQSNAPSSPDFIELTGSSDVIFKSGFE